MERKKTYVSAIILTHNEEGNLPACLRSLSGLAAEVFVVDSGSTDRTIQIAQAAGCRVVRHPFENYAAQRNWSLDHLPLATPWVLCLDAGERLTPELAGEIRQIVSGERSEYSGYLLRKRIFFMGRWIRHGGQYPSYHLRLFRTGTARCEERLYDQHFITDEPVGRLHHDFIDVLASDLTAWTGRHNRWASLEATEMAADGCAQGRRVRAKLLGTPIERKRFLRTMLYQRAPVFVRAFGFWFYSYVLRLGFLDGIPGLIFHTLQRFWFRFLVDAKLYEARVRERESAARASAPAGRASCEEAGARQ